MKLIPTRRRAIVFLLLLLAGPAGPAQAQGGAANGPSPSLRLAEALRAMEDGQVESAAAALDAIADDASGPEAVRYVARLLHGQLSGAFRARQQTWLGRQRADALVVVGDEYRFIEAVDAWTADRAFPVLMDDAWQIALLSRDDQPKAYYRLAATERVAMTAEQFAALAEAHNARLKAATGDGPADAPPPGLVVIDPAHKHRLAGYALAVGRGQPILLMNLPEGSEHVNDLQTLSKLNQTIMTAAAKAGLIRPESWFGITLAGDFPRVYRDPQTKRNLAVDDLIGREGQGLRLGVVGRFWGDRESAVYQAMASLFLQPRRALLFDEYTNRKGGGFGAYRLETAAELLAERMPVTRVSGEDVTPIALRRLTADDPPFDLLLINTMGSATEMNIRGKATPNDLSMGRPRIIHIIHSFSAQKPWDTDTIAGRALLGGAYWYFGSVDEPYLNGFVRPTGMVAKYLACTPLAFAARHVPGHPMYRPWKLMVFGDPLLALREEPAERIAPAGLPGDAEAVDRAELLPEAIDEQTRPSQIAVIAQRLYAQGRLADVVAIDPQRARRHPVGQIVYRLAATERFADQVRAGQLDEAGDTLERYLRVEESAERIKTNLDRWLVAMAKAGRDGAATAWLEAVDLKAATPEARQAIRGRLAAERDADGDPAP